ncbi:winged helix-turn-helix domain-containing protein [Providencia rettgeri]|nr:winged helix-turn-helix domain-containing protein [Providencia rettgeri]
MKYIINHQIIFCVNSRTLLLQNRSENSLILSSPASRLLQLLIINKNTPLTREYLLTKVWEDYGFTASGSNLNNYISELRKSLSYLEPNFSAIVTIPKVGFQFTATIETLLLENTQPETLLLTQSPDTMVPAPRDTEDNVDNTATKEHAASENKKRPSTNKTKHLLKRNRVIFTLLLLPLVIILTYYLSMSNAPLPIEHRKFIFTQGNCTVYSLDEFSILSEQEINQKMKVYLNNKYINCTSGNHYDIYYSLVTKSKNRLLAPEFTAICIRNDIFNQKNVYKTCHSVINWLKI